MMRQPPRTFRKAHAHMAAGLCSALLLAALAGCTTRPPPPPPEEAAAPVSAPVLRQSSRCPRVMLMVNEQNLGSIPTMEVEAMASAMLIQQQVPVVDQEFVKANVAKGQTLLKAAGDARGAAALGQQFGADVVIIGEVVAKPSARRIAESSLRTYQAVATLRAVRTDNAATIASVSEDASIVALDDVSGGSKALKAAGRKTLEALIPAMMASWEKYGGPAAGGLLTRVVLNIGGVDQVWKLKAVRELLRGLGDKAQNLTQRSYTAGFAVFEVETPLTTEEFSEAFVLKPPEGLRMQVLNISPGKVDLRALAVP
ncbi:MAG: hypothetical protein NTV49_04360 [Kiritimatiellaeota bacterium]|nr:hypothetical protein [Kiritimatiellota bacterium]